MVTDSHVNSRPSAKQLMLVYLRAMAEESFAKVSVFQHAA